MMPAVCTRCRKNPPAKSHRWCRECQAAARQDRRQQLKAIADQAAAGTVARLASDEMAAEEAWLEAQKDQEARALAELGVEGQAQVSGSLEMSVVRKAPELPAPAPAAETSVDVHPAGDGAAAGVGSREHSEKKWSKSHRPECVEAARVDLDRPDKPLVCICDQFEPAATKESAPPAPTWSKREGKRGW